MALLEACYGEAVIREIDVNVLGDEFYRDSLPCIPGFD